MWLSLGNYWFFLNNTLFYGQTQKVKDDLKTLMPLEITDSSTKVDLGLIKAKSPENLVDLLMHA